MTVFVYDWWLFHVANVHSVGAARPKAAAFRRVKHIWGRPRDSFTSPEQQTHPTRLRISMETRNRRKGKATQMKIQATYNCSILQQNLKL